MLTLHGVRKAIAPVLVVVGWLAFLGGIIARTAHPVASASLMTVARALP